MTPWVLIIAFLGFPPTSIDGFEDRISCEAAGNEIKYGLYKYPKQIRFSCMPKKNVIKGD